MESYNRKKVVLGMSGGVDSSVAAVLLKQQGFEVIGVSMELYSCDRPMGKGCCTPKDRLDAKRICDQLGLAHDIIDLRSGFKNHVIDYFAAEYAKGRTPLPCAPCNRDVRFKALLDYADAVGAYWIATGHYARVQKNEGYFSLLRGVDFKKDQSYFLWGLSQKELSRLQFPIGPFPKERVREMAREFGLAVSDKPDSQELCFVGDDDHTLFLEEHYPQYVKGPGDFIDEAGEVVGRHRGVHAYTVGQRRGLGAGFGERRYVVKLDAEKNRVLLGSKNQLKANGLVAKNIHWIGPWSVVHGPQSIVRIRSTHKGVAAHFQMEGESLQITFEHPQESVTPGQAAVFYNGDVCLGGGWIERGLS
ncbi:MAG: tRNA 2-thiouridine(34) synthase MnmA [Deltaproteobacteria bacterium]|nr:tRNA 2-thiouridine(34) synthase MnmA [Deltaproteobacteria bacterium]